MTLNTNDLMVNVYDLIANNSIYQPREQLNDLIAEQVEDYYLDNDLSTSRISIIFKSKDGKTYQLQLAEVEE